MMQFVLPTASVRLARSVAPIVLGLAWASCRHVSSPPEAFPIRIEKLDSNERLVAGAKVNGWPVRLAFDTGTGYPFVLLDTAARRVQLELAPPPDPPPAPQPGKVVPRFSEPTTVVLFGSTLDKVVVAVISPAAESKREFELEGLLGWPAVDENIWLFHLNDAAEPVVPVSEMPVVPGAHELRVEPADVLVLSFAADASAPRLVVDTGSADGVALPPKRWEAWKAAHPDAPRTIQTTYMPAVGLTVEEVYWADEFAIGPLTLHDVPVAEASEPYLQHADAEHDIVGLGLAALKRMYLAVDGKTKRGIAAPDPSPAPPFVHNRFGATFSPQQTSGPLELSANVLPRSPAAEADVRNGDVLVAVDGRPAEEWWKDAKTTLSLPPGTSVELTLRRGSEMIRRVMVARNLIGPAPTQAGNSPK